MHKCKITRRLAAIILPILLGNVSQVSAENRAFMMRNLQQPVQRDMNERDVFDFLRKSNAEKGFAFGIWPGSASLFRTEELIQQERFSWGIGFRASMNGNPSGKKFKQREGNYWGWNSASATFGMNIYTTFKFNIKKSWFLEFNTDLIGLGFGKRENGLKGISPAFNAVDWRNRAEQWTYLGTKGGGGQWKMQGLISRRFFKKWVISAGLEYSSTNRFTEGYKGYSTERYRLQYAGLVWGFSYRFYSKLFR